jgi:hypothetical protein
VSALIDRLPVPFRIRLSWGILVAAAFAGGFTVGLFPRSQSFEHTVRVHGSLDQEVARAYGRPSNVVDGAQVNSQLAGTSCQVFTSGGKLVALVCR